MTPKRLLLSAALPALSIFWAPVTLAQVTIDSERTTPISTSDANGNGNADDIEITSDGSIVVASGTAVTIDSDNSVINDGTISIENADDATGINLVGGNSGDLEVGGTINLLEDYTAEDTDDNGVLDGPFAEGSGRTGILISGTSPFTGDISVNAGSSISVEGNDSFAFRLLADAGLVGDAVLDGTINITGARVIGASIEGQMVGNFSQTGSITTRGEGAQAISVTGDIDGQLANGSTISNTGYRFIQRANANGRALLDEDDLRQAGAAISVHGNVSQGISLQDIVSVVTDDDGNETETVVSRSNISQYGNAPAILIDGNGTPISVGRIAEITDPSDLEYDETLQYAFINEGDLRADGVYDDINATAFSVADATLDGGIRNARTIQARAYRSGDDGTDDVDGQAGIARVIVLGDNAMANRINNSGTIIAQVVEATDTIYADLENPLAAREMTAVALDIGQNAELMEFINSGSISAVITGRDGDAIAIRDQSGTLINIENTGTIFAAGNNSDPIGNETTSFNTVALDLSANTSGVTINQLTPVDPDPDDDVTPSAPTIVGDIYLGDGDDTVNVEAGRISGDLAFAGGADSLTLSGGSSYAGALTDANGGLALSVSGGSTLSNTVTTPLNVSSASFTDGSVFRPTLDGATGEASSIVSSGDIVFGTGSTIAPILNNVISDTFNQYVVLQANGELRLESSLDNLQGSESPFLYESTYSLDPNDSNTLLITLELKPVSELGLDPVQAASFNSAFEALQNNSGLANAFVSITEESEFNGAMNQLLPEFAAAARQFVVANVDGAVGAVSTHLNNARLSQDQPGGVWLEEFAYFADRDLAGLSEQYRGYGFGITGGIDTAFGPFHTAGVNLGFASTEIEDVVGFDDPMDILTIQAGAYAGYETGNLGVDLYAGGGWNDFESNRNVIVRNFRDEASGSWSGTHINASLRAGYDVDVSDRFWIRPAASIDYLRLQENAYTESGPLGLALDVEDRTSELAGATAMLNFGAKFEGRRTWLRPSLRVGIRNEFMNDGIVTNFGFAGLDERSVLVSEEFPNTGILAGFTLAAGSGYSSFGLDFDTDVRDGFMRHTGRIVIRLIF